MKYLVVLFVSLLLIVFTSSSQAVADNNKDKEVIVSPEILKRSHQNKTLKRDNNYMKEAAQGYVSRRSA